MKPESKVNHLYCQNLKEDLSLGIHRETQVFCLEVTDIWMDKKQLREKLEMAATETAHKLTYAMDRGMILYAADISRVALIMLVLNYFWDRPATEIGQKH